MKTIAIILALFLAGIGMAAVNGAPQGNATTVPQAIVFENTGFGGEHRHFFASDPDLTVGNNFWNDRISSIAVISGNWSFYADPVGKGTPANLKPVTLGPGVYPDVTRVRIEDNSISQIRLES